MSYQDVVDTAVGYWPLQETLGTVAADATGNSHDGALVGMSFDNDKVTGPTSWLPSALYANGGLLQYVEIPDHIDLRGGGAWSVGGWMDPTSSTIPHLLTKAVGSVNRDYVNFWYNDYGPRWGMEKDDSAFFGGSASGEFLGGQNQWLHFLTTYDGVTGVASLYVNGVLAVTDTSADKSAASTAVLRMFVISQDNTPQKAVLAGVGFWDRVVTAQEVAALYVGPQSEPWPISARVGQVAREGIAKGELSSQTFLQAGSVVPEGSN